MKTLRKTHVARILTYLLLLTLTFTMLPPVHVEAASPMRQAIRAYRKMLGKEKVYVMPEGKKIGSRSKNHTFAYYKYSKKSDVKFALIYLDNDSIPEILLYDWNYGYGIWTYKNKHITCIYSADFYSKPYGYYRKKGVYVENYLTEENPSYRNYFRLPSRPREVWLEKEYYKGKNKHTEYWKGGDSVSRSRFYSILKKKVGSRGMTKIHLHSNKHANRKKYLPR
jgi:hypothetical protein